MEINEDSLLPFLIYSQPITYDSYITLHPITMNDIIQFQFLSKSITVRKNSIFHDKKIIKMDYLNFLIYCLNNRELEIQYNIKELSNYFLYTCQLLQLCCKKSDFKVDPKLEISINGQSITPQIFDDLRRIIIIQNGIDFNIDEFINSDTEQRLLKAEKEQNKNEYKANIEDYIDSLIIAMGITEKEVMDMTIRKFWRYIKRYQLHERYTILKTGECSGMVSFKEPIKDWMSSLDEDDKYEHLKINEETLRGKIG